MRLCKSLLGWALVAIGAVLIFAQAQSDLPLTALADCRAGRGCGYLVGVLVGLVIPIVMVTYGLNLLRGGGTPEKRP